MSLEVSPGAGILSLWDIVHGDFVPDGYFFYEDFDQEDFVCWILFGGTFLGDKVLGYCFGWSLRVVLSCGI